MSRVTIICGNWKMYKTIQEATEFIKTLAPLIEQSQAKVYIAVPFTAIQASADAAKGTSIVIGAQNMNEASEGAFTGEIAGKMLKDAGAQFVILGHSERRHYFNESNLQINKKIKKALQDNLQPILCVGETFGEREGNLVEPVLQQQIIEGLQDLSLKDISRLILAYEPVWAIGTGKTATPEIAQDAHKICRKVIAERFDSEIADNLSILYGGSVQPGNIAALISQPDIDGALVGGAALNAQTFSEIIHYSKTQNENREE